MTRWSAEGPDRKPKAAGRQLSPAQIDAYTKAHGFPPDNWEHDVEQTKVHLRTILTYAAICEDYAKDREAFFARGMEGEKNRLGATKAFEVLAHECKRLHSDYKESRPDIDWREIREARNRTAHEYTGINVTVLWDAVSRVAVHLGHQINADSLIQADIAAGTGDGAEPQ